MGCIVFICNAAISVSAVVFCIDYAYIMQQKFILFFCTAFYSFYPFIIAGTIQFENITDSRNRISGFMQLLYTFDCLVIGRSMAVHPMSFISTTFGSAMGFFREPLINHK